MRNLIKYVVLLFFIHVLVTVPFAQTRQIDSLRLVLKATGENTKRVDALSALAHQNAFIKPDTAMILANQALSLSKKLNYKLGECWAEFRMGKAYEGKAETNNAIGKYKNVIQIIEKSFASLKPADTSSFKELLCNSYLSMAFCYYQNADYRISEENFKIAIRLSEEIKHKRFRTIAISNCALVYLGLSDYPQALKYLLQSLELAEEIGDKLIRAKILGNIGNVYNDQGEFEKAKERFQMCVKLFEELGDRRGIAIFTNNLASVYHRQNQNKEATHYYLKALKIFEENNDIRSMCSAYTNVATMYADAKDYQTALNYYLKSMEIAQTLGDKFQIGALYGFIGNLNTILGNYKEADRNLQKGYAIVQEIGAIEMLQSFYLFLTQYYELAKQPSQALFYYKKHITLRDSIYSQENSKKLLRSEMDHEYEKKKAVADAEHKAQMENQKLIAAEKEKKQNIIIIAVVSGLILVMIFAGFVFRSLRITSKQKKIIEEKNKETEMQKLQIEQKQKEILDSIRYAKRIQMALITNDMTFLRFINKSK